MLLRSGDVGCVLLVVTSSVVVGVASAFDRHLCKSCVIHDCVYCRVTSAYEGGDQCYCPNQKEIGDDDSARFLQDTTQSFACDDHYTSAVTLKTRPDCTFRSPDGEFFLGFLLIGLMLIVSCGCYFYVSDDKDSKNSCSPKRFAGCGSRTRNTVEVECMDDFFCGSKGNHGSDDDATKATTDESATAAIGRKQKKRNTRQTPSINNGRTIPEETTHTVVIISMDADESPPVADAITVCSSSTTPASGGSGMDDTEIEVTPSWL